jgi:serine/threonine-protein kinase
MTAGEADGFLYFVSEVADALDYAHRQDVIQRDIKPETILLHEGHAVVAEVGIGKAVVAAAAESSFTQVGVTVGTPAYMSPEQATGDELDGRSDLFVVRIGDHRSPFPLHTAVRPRLQQLIRRMGLPVPTRPT